LTEQQFLKKLATDGVYEKLGRRFNPDECSIKSIRAQAQRHRSYEVTTNRQDDFVRIRLHINLHSKTSFDSVSMEVDETTRVGQLGDEVFVVYATVDKYYVDAGIYQFATIDDGSAYDNLLLVDAGIALADSDGLMISLGA